MTPENKTARTLRTLVRVGRALREEAAPSAGPTPGLREEARRAAGQAAERLAHSGRVQRLTQGWQDLRAAAAERADQRLEEVLARSAHDDEVARLLAQRRQEREDQAAKARARRALLAHARTDEQRRVLALVAAVTPWAGGEAAPLRYTEVLDRLAPGGGAAQEMAVHRALWTLAEARVLAVSPHGSVTAVPTLDVGPEALPG